MASSVPQGNAFGHEASLDLGVTALEHGLTVAAIPYLEQAVSYKESRYALVQLAKAHRDLGQLEPARKRLEQARTLPDGNDLYVLVTLAAVLCDLREYGSALEVAMGAARLKPEDPAMLTVLARCMREAAQTLAQKDHINQSAIDAVLDQANEFADKARAGQPEAVADLKERRRLRAMKAGFDPTPTLPTNVPLKQTPGAVLDHVADLPAEQLEAVEVPLAEIDSTPSVWRRAWQRLTAHWGS